MTGYASKDRPWLKYFSEEVLKTKTPECSVYEYLYRENRDFPNEIAIKYFNEEVTYLELFGKIDAAAAAFTALGVKSGDIVTVALPSIPEALYVFYALNKIGATANFIHPLAGKKEILNYLNEVGSTVSVMFYSTYEIVKRSLDDTSVKAVVMVSPADSLSDWLRVGYEMQHRMIEPTPFDGKVLTYRQFLYRGLETAIPRVDRDPHSMAVISHTGGTTGEPKGCMISDYNINCVICQVGAAMPHVRQENALAVLPPFVNYSLVNGMLEPMTLGLSVVLIPDYKPLQFDRYVKQYRPGHINSIPAYYEAVLSIPEMKNMDLSCFINCYYGGEAMAEETEKKINELFLSRGAKHPIGKGLGSTEFTSSATATFHNCNIPGSVGIPFPMTICKIVDPETGMEQPYGKVGEICFTGPSLMLGYFENQKATDDLIHTHDDGMRWMHSGDLGYITEDGVIFVSGRIKRIVMTKGPDGSVTKIFPDRVENILLSHPDVELCCVIGVADTQRIHFPKAYIVLKNGITGDYGMTNTLQKFCHDKLPVYMIPDEIEYVADLPRTPRGKVDYRQLEERAGKKT